MVCSLISHPLPCRLCNPCPHVANTAENASPKLGLYKLPCYRIQMMPVPKFALMSQELITMKPAVVTALGQGSAV